MDGSRPRVLSRQLRLVVAALFVGVVGSGAMVWSASQSAFSGATTNPGNSWTAGTVAMVDDDGGATPVSGTAMFNSVSGFTPNSPATVKCITVTYQGNVSAPVKLYGAVLAGHTGLESHLNVKVEIGTAGSGGKWGDCTFGGGFVAAGTLFDATQPGASAGTLAAFATGYPNYGGGLATGWTPTGANQSRVFRFTTTVADTGNGLDCAADFTWEAQA